MGKYVQSRSLLPFTVGATGAAIGSLVAVGGLIGIVGPSSHGGSFVDGELAAADTDAVVELVNSGVVIADGAAVGYNATTGEAVAGGAGDFDAGACLGGAGATDPVLVVLNA